MLHYWFWNAHSVWPTSQGVSDAFKSPRLSAVDRVIEPWIKGLSKDIFVKKNDRKTNHGLARIFTDYYKRLNFEPLIKLIH
jgi:hypothetical protein